MRELKHLNILYINNNSIENKFLEYLEIDSNSLYTHDSLEESLVFLKTKKMDIIFIDDKIDFVYLKKIRELNKNTQIIVFTNIIKPVYLFEAATIHFLKYLSKPIDRIKLINTLRNCVKTLDSNKSNVVKLKNNFIYDSYNNVLFRANKIITLSKKEDLFLNFIINNQNRAITYEEINHTIWKGAMTQDALRSVVKELRKKIYRELIKNISGIGYRIDLV